MSAAHAIVPASSEVAEQLAATLARLLEAIHKDGGSEYARRARGHAFEIVMLMRAERRLESSAQLTEENTDG